MNNSHWWQPRRLVLPVTIGMIFILALVPLTDPDLFWHLANGRLIWSTHNIPRTDPFSFTMYGKEWVCHEWLTEVIMYGLYKVSPAALIIATAAVIAATFALLAARCRTSPFIAAFCVALAALTSTPSLGARPQMLSLFLASLTFYIVEGGAPLWTLVPLSALWANLHAGFFTGTAIVGVYLLGKAIETWGAQDRREGSQAVKQLFFTVIGMALAPLVNPYGIRLLIYPFQTLASSAMRELIVEWFSPDFHKLVFQPLALLLLAIIASLALSKKRPSVTHLILLLGTTYAALNSGRHVPLFALVAAPVLSEQIASIQVSREVEKSSVVNARKSSNDDRAVPKLLARQPSRRFAIIFAAVLIVFLISCCTWRLYTILTKNEAVQMAQYPVEAVNFMRKADLTGNLFNQYRWGGYLIWRGEKVFIDGRADVYGDDFLHQYADLYHAKAHPAEVFQRYDIGYVLIEADCSLAILLEESAGWDKIYQDELASLFVRKS